MKLAAMEICAGGGGQALGLEQAGFAHVALVEVDRAACATLRANRPAWDVREVDLRGFSGSAFRGEVDLLAGGVPCPPFSIAGKQLGAGDDRDLFPEALRLAQEIRPKAVMLENVRGLASPRFAEYREWIIQTLSDLGYIADWRLLNASDFGVPQLRPRFILVALQEEFAPIFRWPEPLETKITVGESLAELMASNGWPGASAWADQAAAVAPTIVGGSKKHGGPDLGPTRAKRQWARLRVDGLGVANLPPTAEFPKDGSPKLTVEMVARIQGFPASWHFSGRKTSAYRQVGNAFPPPVARAVGERILQAIQGLLPLTRVLGQTIRGLPLLDAIPAARGTQVSVGD